MSGLKPSQEADHGSSPRLKASNSLRAQILSSDTIVALATTPGRSAIAVVRVSGSDAERIVRRVVTPARGWPLRPREATRCRMHARDDVSCALDEGLVTVFPAPNSFTGETILELGTHGGEYVANAVCAALIQAGARPAAPGEFSARAVLNGKLDLLCAEATADLVEARSRASHRAALYQMSGALSARVMRLRDATLDLEAMLAFDLDFPEEDDGRLPRERIAAACETLSEQLDALLSTIPAATLGRAGATIVLAGPPNAGKSSLMNALIGETRVLVSETPGTTRDAIEVLLENEPWPLRLVDTAGLRTSEDPVERLGIELSERYLARAHAVVLCAESRPQLLQAAEMVGALTGAPLVGAFTKRDLYPESGDLSDCDFPVVPVSAACGVGLNALVAQVTATVAAQVVTAEPDTPVVTRARHQAALAEARRELTAFQVAWEAGALPVIVAATHVRAARAALDQLIGVVDVEEVFARVFATFCVGK